MYKTIIVLKNSITDNELSSIMETINSAFINRAGNIKNVSIDKRVLVFEGGERDYGCLQLGVLLLRKNIKIKNNFFEWKWIDEEPDECCNILQEISIPVF